MKAETKSGRLDIIGSIISFSCAVHCLAFPILISTGSLMMISEAEYEKTEAYIIIPSVLLCAWSVGRSMKLHRRSLPLILFILSLAVFSFGKFLHLEGQEVILSTTGAILLASAHLTNRRLLKQKLAEPAKL